MEYGFHVIGTEYIGRRHMSNIEKIREFFAGDKYATKLTGARILEAEKNYARCALTLNDDHRNAMGGVMGGVMFTLADFAFAIASNLDSPPTVGLSCNISYLGVAKGSELIATASCLHDGKSTCTYLVNIKDELGNEVASVQCVGFRKSGEPAITSD